MSDRRYDRAWGWWDRAQHEPGGTSRFLAEAPDEVLVELLASREADARPVERNAVATALLNRIGQRAGREGPQTDEPFAEGSPTWDRVSRSDALARAARELAEAALARAARSRQDARIQSPAERSREHD